MAEVNREPIPPGARRRWPMIVVGLLTAHVGAMLLAVRIAGAGGGHAVVPDYYHKAIRWDDLRAEARASEALGWRLSVTPSVLLDANGKRPLRFVLEDADARPIEGARLAVRVWHHAIGRIHSFDAAATGEPGVYTADAPMVQAGTWEYELVAERGSDRFVHSTTLLVVAPTGPGG